MSVSKGRIHHHSQLVAATAEANHCGGGETYIVVGALRIQKNTDSMGLEYGMATAQKQFKSEGLKILGEHIGSRLLLTADRVRNVTAVELNLVEHDERATIVLFEKGAHNRGIGVLAARVFCKLGHELVDLGFCQRPLPIEIP